MNFQSAQAAQPLFLWSPLIGVPFRKDNALVRLEITSEVCVDFVGYDFQILCHYNRFLS